MTRRSARKPAQLTPRQRQIIRLLSRGMTQVAVAIELGISDRTVEMHVARARQRVGVKTTGALLARPPARPRTEHDAV